MIDNFTTEKRPIDRNNLGRRNFLTCGGAVLLVPGLIGCATNRATGRSAFTGFMSVDNEKKVGAENHPKILEQFGGEYGSPRLRKYVNAMGQALADQARRVGDVVDPNINFTFTILNSPITNAFALPGGYVYVSRGLMSLCDNEAELAGVIGHEIGHVTARHAAERYSQSMITQFLLLGASVAVGSDITQIGSIIGHMALAGWSRDQEFEADTLGVRYLALGGYEPRSMASFLRKMNADSRLTAQMMGRTPDEVDNTHLLSTHPRTLDRVEQALPEARKYQITHPRLNRDRYLLELNGMIYGDDPEQGVVRGPDFLHSLLRIAFTVPKGFTILNGQKSVVATHRNKAHILFQGGSKPRNKSIQDILVDSVKKDVRLHDIQSLKINGMKAVAGEGQVKKSDGLHHLRAIAIQESIEKVYLFLFSTPFKLKEAMNVPFRRTVYSFRRLSHNEASGIRPLMLRSYTIKSGDTIARLAAQMPFTDFQQERLILLNNFKPNQTLQPGRLIKIVRG